MTEEDLRNLRADEIRACVGGGVMEYQIVGVSKSKKGRWYVLLEEGGGGARVSIEIFDNEIERYGGQISASVTVHLMQLDGDVI